MRKRRVYILAAALLALALGGRQLMLLYSEWLWFGAEGFASVFATRVKAQAGIGAVVGALFLFLGYANVVVALRVVPRRLRSVSVRWWEFFRSPPFVEHLNWVCRALLLLGAGLAGWWAARGWEVVLQGWHATRFGEGDPVFGRDLSFYLFTLPLYRWLWAQGFSALLFALLLTLGIYFCHAAIQVLRRRLYVAAPVRAHLSALLALMFLWQAWGFYLGRFKLLLSHHAQAVFAGANYTDVHLRLPAYGLLIILCLVGAGVLLLNLRWRAMLPITSSVGGLAAAWLALQVIAPAGYYRARVRPNEPTLEGRYMRHHIRLTRLAFNLHKVRSSDFTMPRDGAGARMDAATLRHIRLWDHRPLVKTLKQLQEIRWYYTFLEPSGSAGGVGEEKARHVDADRYWVDGQYRQVAIAARELDVKEIGSRVGTWVTQRQLYTHGYGACVVPVNEATPEGQPVFFVRDIPPVVSGGSAAHKGSGFGALHIARPEIYFGEAASEYCLVNTKNLEFDYPTGARTFKSVRYPLNARAGVKVGSALRRLAFATRLGDPRLLLTRDMTPHTRIFIRRHIRDRAHAVAPFLLFDSDPYLVIAWGKLWWAMDAYTTSQSFPYAERYAVGGRRVNYARNSVKVVVDAYSGAMRFYIADGEDVVLRTWRKIFPRLFTSQTPKELRAHWRYPSDLFTAQAQAFARYHMTNIADFYQGQDLWDVAQEIYEEGKGEQAMPPYYALMKLPDGAREEFVLMLPFTPAGKDNLIAWMAARCDGARYGELIAFHFPSGTLVDGPKQVESLISEQPEINRQFSLWSDELRRSQVVRGTLLVIPMGGALLYVEPIYLQAGATPIPLLKQVIVARSPQPDPVMAPTLGEALAWSGIGEQGLPARPPQRLAEPRPAAFKELAEEALSHLRAAQETSQRGEWKAYGEAMGRLQGALEKMRAANGGAAGVKSRER